MAYLDREEYIPVWLPHWLPAEILEEIFLGILAGGRGAVQALPAEPEPTYSFIDRHWFGPFLFSPPTRCLRGSC